MTWTYFSASHSRSLIAADDQVSSFKDNIWGNYLAYMQLLSRFNKRISFLLCVIDIYGKYSWVIPLNDKKFITITSAFRKNLNKSGRKQTNYGKIKAVSFTIDP